MWEIKYFKFKTAEGFQKAQKRALEFIEKNKHRYIMDISYFNNAVGVEYKPLRVIKFD